MVTLIHRAGWWNGLALSLVLPTVIFLILNILKYEFGVHEPFDSISPLLAQLGLQEDLGFNINLLLIFGPPIALTISLFQVLHIDAHFSREQYQFAFTIRKKWLPLFTTFISGLVLCLLFLYRMVENCNC